MQSGQGEITLLLMKWKDGEPQAFDQLMPLVYPQLKHVAASYLRRERNPGVMQATMLVHELYLRLLGENRTLLTDRSHFYAFYAKVMRLILIDHARETLTQRRGGGARHVPLNHEIPWVDVGSAEILQLNLALDELETIDAYKVKVRTWLYRRLYPLSARSSTPTAIAFGRRHSRRT